VRLPRPRCDPRPTISTVAPQSQVPHRKPHRSRRSTRRRPGLRGATHY
jgi:hypothetical protein